MGRKTEAWMKYGSTRSSRYLMAFPASSANGHPTLKKERREALAQAEADPALAGRMRTIERPARAESASCTFVSGVRPLHPGRGRRRAACLLPFIFCFRRILK